MSRRRQRQRGNGRSRRRHGHGNWYVCRRVFSARLHGILRRTLFTRSCQSLQELLHRVVLDLSGPSKLDQYFTLTVELNRRPPRCLAHVFQVALPALRSSVSGKTDMPARIGASLILPGRHVPYFGPRNPLARSRPLSSMLKDDNGCNHDNGVDADRTAIRLKTITVVTTIIGGTSGLS